MAVSKIKAPQVKEFSYTGTTSGAGTLNIPDAAKPSDFHCVVGIKGTNNGNYYVVQYDAYTFGVFRFDHVALANQSIGVTFMYVWQPHAENGMATSIIPKADFIVVSASQTQSVAPGTGMFYLTPTIPSGYIGIGVVGFDVNYAECSVNACYWSGTKIVIQARNNYSSALSVQVTGKLLCYKG